MPLVKVRPYEATPWAEETVRHCATVFPGTSVWRWDAAASRWTELPCTAAEWFRHDLFGGPLPGVPAGPLHATALFLHEGVAVPVWAKTTFAVVDGDGREVEGVGIDPALEPRIRELDDLPKRTPEERAEWIRIHEEAWRPFEPTPEMKRRRLLDLGARFDLSEVRSLL